jgi:hypothetical protein
MELLALLGEMYAMAYILMDVGIQFSSFPSTKP